MTQIIRFSLLSLSFLFTLLLVAQPSNCIFGDEFDGGSEYGLQQGNVPGDVIYQNDGTTVSLQPFTTFNSPVGTFGEVTVATDLGFGSEAPYFSLSSIDLVFDLYGSASTFCFITSNSGTPINFGINNGVGNFFGINDPSINDSFPDFEIIVSDLDDTPFDPIQVCIYGSIEQVTIGGESIFLDNICSDYYSNPSCGFFGPSFEPYCAADSLNLNINFSEIVGNNEAVDLFLDGQFYGFYPINAFPLTLQNVLPFGVTDSLSVRVCINDDPDCCYETLIAIPNCTSESCVEFELLSPEMEVAFANGFPYDSVYHVENGIRFTQRQMQIEGDQQAADGTMFRFIPNAIPAFNTANFITIGHANANSEMDLTGYGSPITYASLDFYRFAENTYLNIGVNGQEIAEPNGAFQASVGTTTLPDGTVRRISYYSGDTNLGRVEFFGYNLTEIVFGGEGVAMDNLCFNSIECEIAELEVSLYDCGEINGNDTYLYAVDFEHSDLALDSFYLEVNDWVYGVYAYDDLPITGVQLTGGAGTEFTFTVRDIFFEDCSATVPGVLGGCDEICELFSASAVETVCTDPFFNETSVTLSSPAVGQTVTVQGLSGGFFQTATYSSSFGVTFGYFIDDNDPEGYILTDGLTGCTTIIPTFPPAPADCMECFIEDASITVNPCNEDGFYSVNVDVFGFNFFQAYYVSIAGEEYGPFNENEFPVTVGQISGFNNESVLVEIFGGGGNCYYAEDVFQLCENELCPVYTITNFSCDDSEQVQLVFTSTGVPGNPFYIALDDQLFVYEHSGGEEQVFEFPATGQNSYQVVFIEEESQCAYTYNFDSPCASCVGFVPFVSFIECLPEDSIYVAIGLEGLQPDERPIAISDINGNPFFQTFFTQNPILVPIAVNGSGGGLIVTDLSTGCEQVVQYQVPSDCIEGCEDFAAEWVSFQCTDSLDIDLFVELSGIDTGQDILIQNLNTGSVRQTSFQGNPMIFSWPTFEEGILQFIVGDQCTATINYQTPEECIEECIDTFDFLGVDCSNNGLIRFSFLAEGDPDYSFTASVNGTTLPLQYGLEQYVFQFAPTPGQDVYEVVLQDQQSGCISVFTIDNPCFCIIENIEYDIIECNSVGEWFLDLSLSAGSPNGDDIIIISAGGYTQAFPEGAITTTLGPFTNSINEPLTVNIFAEFQNCGESITINYGCPQTVCDIYEMEVTGSSCDSEGNYFIDVYFESDGGNIFEVAIPNLQVSEIVTGSNGQTVTLGPFNIEEVQTMDVYVAAQDAECVELVTFTQECQPQDECNFTDVFAEGYECDGDLFMVDIEFNNGFGGPLGFYVFGDGMIFGPFQYGESFYTFGPLNGSQANHNIMLLDIADPACFANYTLLYSCTDECLIQELVLTPSACNDDGTFFVTVDVDGNNLGESFTLLGNGQNYGNFNYNDLPVEVGPFDGDGETVYELGIIDLNNPDCSLWNAFGPVNCNPCNISGLVYEVDCNNNSEVYTLTIDFAYDNPTSDFFFLQIGDEIYEGFTYESLPLTLPSIPLSFNGNTIRVEDSADELCGQTIDFDLPCCNLGNALNELEVEACLDNGEYYLSVNEFTSFNTTDSLVIDYAPAGTTIIASVTVAYSDLPTQIGPLIGDGNTGYLVVLSDQTNGCSVNTNVEPVFCDNGACIEFEELNGVFSPAFGQDSGSLILTENGVAITYERNPVTECACNLFVTNGIPGVPFGNGQIVATQNSGFGMNFTEVQQSFNTVNIDYYYPGGGITVIVNGAPAVTVEDINDLPTTIADAVELQVINDPNNPNVGMLTFNGEIISIQIFSNESAAFDNVCLSMDDNVWPGDTNTDNVASHLDLLNIGLAYGNTGPSRQEVTNDWAGLISANWGENFSDGTNHKHADANGDGVIDEADRQVLLENYGLEHGPVQDFQELEYTSIDPPIYVDVSSIEEASAGMMIEIPVMAGDIDQEIQDIYGLAFTIQLDPEVLDMSSLQVIYPTSWFGVPGVNTTTIERIYDDGRIEVALSRIDHNNVSGFGEIMRIRVIIDDIAGIYEVPTDIRPKAVYAIGHNEVRMPIRPEDTQLIISSTTKEIDRDLLRRSFLIYPNPTQGMVHFRNQYGMGPDRLIIHDAAGRQLANLKNPGMDADLSTYPAGVYFLQVHLQGYIFTERVVKTE